MSGNGLDIVNATQKVFWAVSNSESPSQEHSLFGSFSVNLLVNDGSASVGDTVLTAVNPGLAMVIVLFVFLIALPGTYQTCWQSQKGSSVFKTRVKGSSYEWREVINISFILGAGTALSFSWWPDDVGNAFGYIGCAYAFIAVLPATRNSVVTLLVRLPFERTVVYHRWIGRFTLLASTAHALWYILKWIDEGTVVENMFQNQKNLFGFISLLALTIVYVTSIEYIRRHYYQFFRWVHYLFIVFYAFGVLHTFEFLPYVIAASVFNLFDLALRYRFGTLRA